MSRSYKKPYVNDKAHWKKKLASRAYRRACKQVTRVFCKDYSDFQIMYGDWFWNEEDFGLPISWHPTPLYPHLYEITNPYDVCDWQCRVNRWYKYGGALPRVYCDNLVCYKKACRK